MPTLPIHASLPDILQTLHSHHRLVLQAPPGAGKTTAVPLALLDQPWLRDRQIIMLEPRRLAARNAAARMAFLLGEKTGETVGYHIRQDTKRSERTRILVVTEGILTRLLQADPELAGTALVIFDEFHERSLHADLALALCLQSQQVLREDLKILVMSATLATADIAGLLGDAPVISSEGRSFPVAIRYLDKSTVQTTAALPPAQQLQQRLLQCVKQALSRHQGNILVFLPGAAEIRRLETALTRMLSDPDSRHIVVAPLYGRLDRQQQDLAISAPPAGKRKIVLATNIAETSLTIEGIDCVIDTGLERIQQYDPASGMDRLQTQFISQDSATQRSGRAGRLGPGHCYRLWPERQRLQEHAMPEILRSDLSAVMLELAGWGVKQVEELQWLDTPPAAAAAQARSLLRQLQAIDSEDRITPHGRQMLSLGTHPRLAHMMLQAASLDLAWHGCLLAAILTEKDIFTGDAKQSIDIDERIRCLEQARKTGEQPGIDRSRLQQVRQTAESFYRRLPPRHRSARTGKKPRTSPDMSGVLLAFAYPERLARQRHDRSTHYLLRNGKGALIPEWLQQHDYPWLAIAHLDAGHGSDARIHLAAEITQAQVEEYFADQITHSESLHWNAGAGRVEALQSSRIGHIRLQEKRITPRRQTEVLRHLLQAVRETGLQSLNLDDRARRLQQRLQFVHRHSDRYDLPDFSDPQLLATLEDWLLPHLRDENSLKQLRKHDIGKILLARLDWAQQQLLDKLAPEKITVPSGSRINIDYSDPAQPVLAVRLQEVFGLRQTPMLLDGKVPLLMHLLSPARRPMQVTRDLHSFWQSAYHEIKKELRGKYKKHYWPDDPLTAQATSKTKKQMQKYPD